MPMSQYVDSFFFLSLGITFILLFLMAFHFKTRISAIERKNNTLTDICTTMVSEIGTLKSRINQMSISVGGSYPNIDTAIYRGPIEQENESSDEEYEDDDYESEDEEELDVEIETNNGATIIVLDETTNVSIDLEEIEDADSRKIIVDEQHAPLPIDLDITEEEDEVVVVKQESNNQVEELEEIILDETKDSEIESTIVPSMSTYRKMTVQMLRTIVIRDGLCTDPSKLKKQELLKILSDAIE
jgi:hypothetical protein